MSIEQWRYENRNRRRATPPTVTLVDMHCHLELMANGDEVAREAAACGLGMLDAAVTPQDFARARETHADNAFVRCAVGLHPWWIADGRLERSDIDQAVLACSRAQFVGEVGLDAGGRRAETLPVQRAALELIAEACATHPVAGRVLTIHAVRTATDVLDILERFDLTRQAACIFHWFSGTSDELVRARHMGCFFSIGERMLASKRGRAYARAVPEDRLLLETDAPAENGETLTADAIAASLARTLAAIAELRQVPVDELGATVLATSRRLMGWS